MGTGDNRIASILLAFCRLHTLSAGELAERLEVSERTVRNDIKQLNEDLKGCAAIEGAQGRETDIQNYVLEHAYEALYRDYPLDPEITELVDAVSSQSPFEKSEPFQRFLTVSLDRFLTGHPLEGLPQAFYSLTARREFAVVDRLLEEIGRFLHVEFPPEEKLFVLLPIVGMRTPADAENMKAIELDQAMGPLADKIFRQIKLELNIALERPEFLDEFLYHLMFMINRLRFHVRLKSDVVAELREKYPLAWQMGGVAAQVIRAEYGVEVTEDERSYLASYFGVFLEETAKRRPFRAAVVCGTGRVTARLVAAQLKRVLDSSWS